MTSTAPAESRLSVLREGPDVVVRLGGAWSLQAGLPSAVELDRALDASPAPRRVRVEESALERWDSGLVVVLGRIQKACEDRGLELDLAGAPPGALRLLEMARGTVAPLVGPARRADRRSSSRWPRGSGTPRPSSRRSGCGRSAGPVPRRQARLSRLDDPRPRADAARLDETPGPRLHGRPPGGRLRTLLISRSSPSRAAASSSSPQQLDRLGALSTTSWPSYPARAGALTTGIALAGASLSMRACHHRRRGRTATPATPAGDRQRREGAEAPRTATSATCT